jgi:hypothetical protein
VKGSSHKFKYIMHGIEIQILKCISNVIHSFLAAHFCTKSAGHLLEDYGPSQSLLNKIASQCRL